MYIFNKQHPTRAGETLNPAGTYIMTFDSRDLAVSDHAAFHSTPDDPLSLLKFKALLINTLDNFVAEYSETVMQIAQACAKLEKIPPGQRLGKPIILDVQSAIQLIQRAHMRLEMIIQDVMKWDGKSPFSVMVPYAVVAERDITPGDIIGQPRELDTAHCRPLVNGMIFLAEYAE